MQLLIRLWSDPFSHKIHELCFVFKRLMSLLVGISGFKILLTVQTGSLDESDTSLQRAMQQNHIHRKEILLLDFYDIADCHFTPFHFLPGSISEYLSLWFMVHLVIRLMSLIIFIPFSQNRYRQYHNQRRPWTDGTQRWYFRYG
jgi:hypothetical protein